MPRFLSIVFMLCATPAIASEPRSWCPAEELPYTFTMFEDVLMINRMNHRAFCQHLDADNYECVEKYLGIPEPSVYTVKASVTRDGFLAFSPPLNEGKMMLIRPCE